METHEMKGNEWRFYLPSEQMPNPAGYLTREYDATHAWPESFRVAGAMAYLVCDPLNSDHNVIQDMQQSVDWMESKVADASGLYPPDIVSQMQAEADDLRKFIDEMIDKELGL